MRGVHSPGINSPISGPGGGGGEYSLQGRENYSVVGGLVVNTGGGTATSGGHGYWGGARSRRGSGWGEVHTHEEDGRPRMDEDDDEDDEDDVGSVRSRRTASIASGKTGRVTEDEGAHAHDLGGCGVVAVGAKSAESPAPVVLNKVLGKGKGKGKIC